MSIDCIEKMILGWSEIREYLSHAKDRDHDANIFYVIKFQRIDFSLTCTFKSSFRFNYSSF